MKIILLYLNNKKLTVACDEVVKFYKNIDYLMFIRDHADLQWAQETSFLYSIIAMDHHSPVQGVLSSICNYTYNN